MNNVRKLWENSNISRQYPELSRTTQFDEPMKEHTSFKIGGPADAFFSPASEDELCALIEFCADHAIPVSIFGGGSNVVVADRGIRGAVISFERFNHIALHQRTDLPKGSRIVCAESGVSMQKLTEWCRDAGYAGLQRFAGLPGSVGGAVFMNARCYDLSVSDVFFEAYILKFHDRRCTLQTRAYIPSEWGYKQSPFQYRTGKDPLALDDSSQIILSACFVVKKEDYVKIQSEMETLIHDREKKGHFRYPSAGSMFRNNRLFGKPSGKIIDEAGLCGFRIGDAQVAPWHGNLVINTGSACAQDVRSLVEEVRQRVYDKTAFMLEPEVIFTGDW